MRTSVGEVVWCAVCGVFVCLFVCVRVFCVGECRGGEVVVLCEGGRRIVIYQSVTAAVHGQRRGSTHLATRLRLSSASKIEAENFRSGFAAGSGSGRAQGRFSQRTTAHRYPATPAPHPHPHANTRPHTLHLHAHVNSQTRKHQTQTPQLRRPPHKQPRAPLTHTMRGYLKNNPVCASRARGNGRKKDPWQYSRLGAGAKGRRH